MVVVDIAIVNVALPTIQRQLHISQDTLQWIVIAYGLLFGSFLLLGGRLGDVFGRKRVLLTGLSLFTAASLVAGLSHTAGLLIGARAAQGLGAALIPPTALAILASTFNEGKERNGALGVYGAVTGMAASVGVIASGLLTDGPGWRWVFFINIPIGLLLLALTGSVLRSDSMPKEAGEHHLDVSTAVTASAGLLSFIYALNRGAAHGWTNGMTLAFFGLAAALFAAFALLERRSNAPLVLFDTLKQNQVLRDTNIVALLGFGGFFGFIFLTTLLAQQQLGYSALHTGLIWLFTTVSSFVVAAMTGAKLAFQFGPRKLLGVGLALMTIVGLLLFRLPLHAHFATDILPALLLAGIGGGLIGPAIQISALSGATPTTFGFVSGFLETMRELGGVIVIATVSTVLIARLKTAAALRSPAAHTVATQRGFRDAFLVIAGASLLGLIVTLLGFKPNSAAAESPQLATEL